MARPDNFGNQHYKAGALSGAWEISDTSYQIMHNIFWGYALQGGSRIEKKDLGSIFSPSTLGGLTNYVIRHMSKYGNIMSSSASFNIGILIFLWQEKG